MNTSATSATSITPSILNTGNQSKPTNNKTNNQTKEINDLLNQNKYAISNCFRFDRGYFHVLPTAQRLKLGSVRVNKYFVQFDTFIF